MSGLVLYRHHIRRLARPGRLILTGALALLPAGIVLVSGITSPDLAEETAGIVANVGSTTFPIAVLILAASTLRDERDDGTLPYLYLAPISRPAMAAISAASGATVTAAVGALAALAVTLATALVGGDASFGLAAIPAYVAAAVGYSFVFVPAGYLIQRVILVGLAYVILWEQIVARLVTGVANTSVWRFAISIYADLVPRFGPELSDSLGPVAPGTGGAVLKVAVVVLLGWLLLTWALRTRDTM